MGEIGWQLIDCVLRNQIVLTLKIEKYGKKPILHDDLNEFNHNRYSNYNTTKQ